MAEVEVAGVDIISIHNFVLTLPVPPGPLTPPILQALDAARAQAVARAERVGLSLPDPELRSLADWLVLRGRAHATSKDAADNERAKAFARVAGAINQLG